MAEDPIGAPVIRVLLTDQLVPLLRASFDPEGEGDLSPEQAAMIAQVEANIAAYRGS